MLGGTGIGGWGGGPQTWLCPVLLSKEENVTYPLPKRALLPFLILSEDKKESREMGRQTRSPLPDPHLKAGQTSRLDLIFMRYIDTDTDIDIDTDTDIDIPDRT